MNILEGDIVLPVGVQESNKRFGVNTDMQKAFENKILGRVSRIFLASSQHVSNGIIVRHDQNEYTWIETDLVRLFGVGDKVVLQHDGTQSPALAGSYDDWVKQSGSTTYTIEKTYNSRDLK